MPDLPPMFTAVAAREAGTSRGSLRHGIATGRLVSIRRGVFARRDWWEARCREPGGEHAARVAAVVLSSQLPMYASHYSAAALLRLPVPSGEPVRPVFTSPMRGAMRRADRSWVVRNAALPTGSRVLVKIRGIGAVPATSPARTSIDIARQYGFAAGLVVADAVLRRGLATRRDLHRCAAGMAGWPGSVAAAAMVEYADGARESPAESRSFALFVTRGLVLPACNVWVVGEGRGGVRADFP